MSDSDLESTPSRVGDTVEVRRSVLRLARVAAFVAVGLLVFQFVLWQRLAKESAKGRQAVVVADSLRQEFQRLRGVEAEIAHLRALNDKILGLAGIHRPPPEDTADSDHSARGLWSYSPPTRPPRIGMLSRGFHAQHESDAHPGVDIPGPTGVPIRAAGGGIVARATLDPHYGNVVRIDHGGGVESLYGHNEELLVQEGDSVWVGQSIARLGSTGRSSAPHLHFEILVNGIAVDPATFVDEYETAAISAK